MSYHLVHLWFQHVLYDLLMPVFIMTLTQSNISFFEVTLQSIRPVYFEKDWRVVSFSHRTWQNNDVGWLVDAYISLWKAETFLHPDIIEHLMWWPGKDGLVLFKRIISSPLTVFSVGAAGVIDTIIIFDADPATNWKSISSNFMYSVNQHDSCKSSYLANLHHFRLCKPNQPFNIKRCYNYFTQAWSFRVVSFVGPMQPKCCFSFLRCI